MYISQYVDTFDIFYSNIKNVIKSEVESTDDVVLDLNKDQFLSGRNIEGNLLAPGYTQDPYFKTRRAAQRYQQAKIALESLHRSRLTFPQLYPDKPTDTPNLIIRGDFQNMMYIKVSGNSYTIGSSYKDSDDINTKYNNRLFGLAPASKTYYTNGFIIPAITNYYNTLFK